MIDEEPLPTFAEVRRYDPLLRADWRWRDAEVIVDNKIPNQRWQDDIWLALAVHARHNFSKPPEERSKHRRLRLVERVRRLEEHNRWKRLEIRLRLLAGQSDQEIAAAMGVSVGVVACFAALCYDVRNRLKACDWLTWLHHQFDPKGFVAPSLAVAAFQMAWHGGAAVLPHLLAVMAPGGKLLDQAVDLSSFAGRCDEWVRLKLWTDSVGVHEVTETFWIRLASAGLIKPMEQVDEASVRGVLARAWKLPDDQAEKTSEQPVQTDLGGVQAVGA